MWLTGVCTLHSKQHAYDHRTKKRHSQQLNCNPDSLFSKHSTVKLINAGPTSCNKLAYTALSSSLLRRSCDVRAGLHAYLPSITFRLDVYASLRLKPGPICGKNPHSTVLPRTTVSAVADKPHIALRQGQRVARQTFSVINLLRPK